MTCHWRKGRINSVLVSDTVQQGRLELGCVSSIDSKGRTIWIADAHRDDGKRFVVRADEKLTAFLELESAIRAGGEMPRQAGEIFPNSPDMKRSIPPALIALALVCFALALHIACH
jgi:hypothetical protein